jgi:hypothetical protein
VADGTDRAEPTELVELLASVLAGGDEATLMERLCARAMDELRVDDVVVTLLSPPDHRHVVCASSDQAVVADDVQFTVGDGPAVEAFRDRVPVLVADLPAEAVGRWPLFGEADARWPRYAGVFAFPLSLSRDDAIGVMGLYRRSPGPLDASGARQARVLADAMALAVVRAIDHDLSEDGTAFPPDDGDDLAADPDALDRELGLTRWSGAEQVVYQAVGMVVAQLHLEPADAMTRLRAHAFAAGVTLDTIALDVVERRLRLER